MTELLSLFNSPTSEIVAERAIVRLVPSVMLTQIVVVKEFLRELTKAGLSVCTITITVLL